MSKIGFIRHASYHSPECNGGVVSEIGESETNFLVHNLKYKLSSLGLERVKVISSPAGRAMGTAAIIAHELSAGEVEVHNCLWTDEEHERDYTAVRDVIRSHLPHDEVLLVVSHSEVVNEITEEVLIENGQTGAARVFNGLSAGECAFVDLDENTFQLIF